MFTRTPAEVPSLALEVDTVGLHNGPHAFEMRRLSLAPETRRQLPGDAPRMTVGFVNGFVESASTVELAAAAVIGVGAAHGTVVDTFAINAPASYSQEQHTDDALLAYKEAINRSQDGAHLVGVGHSRGSITLTNVHEQLPDDIAFSLDISPPGCNPLRLSHKGIVTAVMAGRLVQETLLTGVHLSKDLPKIKYGASVMASLGRNGLSHFFQYGLSSVAAATDEVQEIVQSEKYAYMNSLVRLQEVTGATGVAICAKDALCAPHQSARNLRAAGYAGKITLFPKATHIDPLARPKAYAPKIYDLLVEGLHAKVPALQ